MGLVSTKERGCDTNHANHSPDGQGIPVHACRANGLESSVRANPPRAKALQQCDAYSEGAEMKFRKKPVVIEAWQLPENVSHADVLAAPVWARGISFYRTGGGDKNEPMRTVALIQTLEGAMRAEPLDWIIKGVKGELYPCKPDIFAATYEPVEAA
jgi:hypothetical protein